MLGAGGLSYYWWQSVDVTGAPDDEATDDWAAELVCEDGNEDFKTVTISHSSVIETAKKLTALWLSDPEAAENAVGQEALLNAARLIFAPDECDFDAGTADCLLQYMVLGE